MTDIFDPSVATVGDPVTIIRGYYVDWRRAIELDPVLYALKYVFHPRGGGTVQTVNGAKTGTGYWGFFALGATTSSWVVGDYWFDVVIRRLSDSAEAVIATGNATVFTSTADRRSFAAIMVEKIESILQGRAVSDVDSYTIANRSISKMSITELTKWRDYFRNEVSDESLGGGGTNNHKIKARFVD